METPHVKRATGSKLKIVVSPRRFIVHWGEISRELEQRCPLLLTFTGAVGGRVYFRSRGVYVNERREKKRTELHARAADCAYWAAGLMWSAAPPIRAINSSPITPEWLFNFPWQEPLPLDSQRSFLACKYWKTSWRFLNCGPFRAGHPFITASWWAFAGW